MRKCLFSFVFVCFAAAGCRVSSDSSSAVVPRVRDDEIQISGSALSLEMISILNTDSIVLGEDVENPVKTSAVLPFSMSKYEVSYNVWRFVYKWAVADSRGENKYVFENPGAEGQYGSIGSSRLFNEGGEPLDEGIPVCGINWRDSVVWCNALSELCGLAPVLLFRLRIPCSSTKFCLCGRKNSIKLSASFWKRKRARHEQSFKRKNRQSLCE